MRTKENWESKMLPHVLAKLSPRIRKDLRVFKPPKNLRTGSLYIHGPVGSGKTLYAAWMFVEFNKQVYLNAGTETSYFVNVSELIDQLKDSYETKSHDLKESEHKIMSAYSHCDFLVLDDFGAERPTEWARSKMYLLVNRRYEELRTTVFTSNYSLEDVVPRWDDDDRVPNRIDQMCELVEKLDY